MTYSFHVMLMLCYSLHENLMELFAKVCYILSVNWSAYFALMSVTLCCDSACRISITHSSKVNKILESRLLTDRTTPIRAKREYMQQLCVRSLNMAASLESFTKEILEISNKDNEKQVFRCFIVCKTLEEELKATLEKIR